MTNYVYTCWRESSHPDLVPHIWVSDRKFRTDTVVCPVCGGMSSITVKEV